jgi:hypothetical protein
MSDASGRAPLASVAMRGQQRLTRRRRGNSVRAGSLDAADQAVWAPASVGALLMERVSPSELWRIEMTG